MDLQDDRRALIISGTLARKQRTELDWSGWNDYYVVLLDNYRAQILQYFIVLKFTADLAVIVTREEKRSNGDPRYVVASRVRMDIRLDCTIC